MTDPREAKPTQPPGLEQPGVLDAIAHDTRTNEVVLAMFETRPWTLGDLQLYQLQEKLNAYASFILDGELAETYPELKDKKVVIHLRTRHEPSVRALDMVAKVREQLAFQNIGFEVILMDDCGDQACACS